MFAYCNNAPINRFDNCGNIPKEIFECGFLNETYYGGGGSFSPGACYSAAVGKQLKKLAVDLSINARKELEKIEGDGTLSVGLSLSGVLGGGIGGSIAIVIDRFGNIGLVISASGITGSPSSGSSVFASVTNAPGVSYSAGESFQTGFSGNVLGVQAGLEHASFSDRDGNSYHGMSVNFGLGATTGAEWHTSWQGSVVLFQINLYDLVFPYK